MQSKFLVIALVLIVTGASAIQSNTEVEKKFEQLLSQYQDTPVDAAANKAQIEDFVKGFVTGVGSAKTFKDIKACINYDETILKDLAQAFKFFQSKDPAEFKKGLKLLGDAAKVVPVAAQMCSAAGFDIKRIVKMIQTFSNPQSFLMVIGRNILINRVEVFHEIQALRKANTDKDFESIGYWTAKTMLTVILGENALAQAVIETAPSKDDWKLFAQGFMRGIQSDPLFDKMKACITEDKEVVEDIKKAIELIKTKKPEKVKEGIQLIGKIVEAIPVAANDCKIAEEDIRKLIKLVQTFKDPKTFVYYVGKSLIINHVEVIEEINKGIDAYTAHDFKELGYWVGKAMDTIFLHGK